jgi:serine/threonine protein kinase
MAIQLGTRIGRYKILQLIGKGGMAEVYKVHDPQRAKPLAMKVLRAELAGDRTFLAQFEEEARTLAKLKHPNIVRFYGFEREGKTAAILMDYIDGESLRKRLQRNRGKPFSSKQIKKILGPVGRALHYAHQMGVVHCDLKPGNILIDRSGQVFISDFGIARRVYSSGSALSGAGSPAYMAPELVNHQEPLPQSDIYALGVMLYEMASGGEQPFTGERAGISGSTAEKIRWEQVHLEPKTPHGVDETTAAVILRCLRKDADARYATAQQMVAELGEGKIERIKPEKKKREKKVKAKKLARQARKIPVGWILCILGILCAAIMISRLFQPSDNGDVFKNTVQSENIAPAQPLPQPQSPGSSESGDSSSDDNMFIVIRNDCVGLNTMIDIAVCNWDARDQNAIFTLTRPDGVDQTIVKTFPCCFLMDCGGINLPAWDMEIEPESSDSPGVWQVQVTGSSTGKTAILEFTVDRFCQGQ